MMTLTHGELFAGISGFGLGFERAGIPVSWAVEIDPTCRVVLRRHHPDALILEDVCEVGAHNLTPVDIITFGSPCQDLSVAGRRAGFDGRRSGLFFEAVRIIKELRPRWAIWENVPGALSSNGGRDFGAALDALADAGAVDICWRVLDAQWFGVAQRRQRVFLVASFRADTSAAQVLFEPTSCGGDSPPRRETGQGTTYSLAPSLRASGPGFDRIGDTRGQDCVIPVDLQNVRFGSDDIAGTLDTTRPSRGGGQAVAFIPDVAGTDSTRYGKGVNTTCDDGAVIAFSSKDYGNDATTDLAPTMRSMNFDQSHINGGGQIAVAFGISNQPTPKFGIDIAPSLDAKAEGGGRMEAVAYGLSGQLNAVEEVVNNLQVPSSTGGGHPAMVGMAYSLGSHSGAADAEVSNKSHATGGPSGMGIQPELSHTLKSGRTQAVAHAMAVRRLTPTECERLQGFPEVEENVIIEIWKKRYPDQQKSDAPAATPSPRSPKRALNADATRSNASASSVESPSRQSHPGHAKPVALTVRIDCERGAVEIRSPERLLLRANSADDSAWSALPMPPADFVRLGVAISTILARTMPGGKAASPPSNAHSGVLRRGSHVVRLCGSEIAAHASDAAANIDAATRHTKSTTSVAGSSSPNSDSTLATLCSSVIHAISGFIPSTTQADSSYAVSLTLASGWTAYGADGKPLSDSVRYRQLGNAVCVPVAAWIGKRIMEVA